ncbi:MAG TPA: patatin-like phospholipase family protein [Bryobacteraceae bacterium]|nr:patatin-like phospholipase family protein [Bryobacteraceae bacterium]
MPNEPSRALEDKIALCLSGGGYRAMVFHLGALWRLNELGYLGRIDRFSSVSGGSITAGVLALHWNELGVTPDAPAPCFGVVVDAVRRMASETIDVGSIFAGVLGPGAISDKIQSAYDKLLFHGASLQDLPDAPRFVFNATSVQSGVLWRFSKPYMADWRVGRVLNPRVPLAVAVGASSAFPPVLSPAKLDLSEYGCVFEAGSGADLQKEPYISKAVLTDGGVYDNLGLETAWKRYKTVLVSDAGGQLAAEPQPHQDWGRHSFRVLELIDNQVRSLRKRQVIGAFEAGTRLGTYWGIRTDISRYALTDSLPCPFDETTKIAAIATRLKKLANEDQERLINWGYAVADAAMRKHVNPALPPAAAFPYPRGVE